MNKEVINMNETNDDYKALDEISTPELLEMKDGALQDLSDLEHLIHRINQVLDSRINGERPKLF